MSCGRKPAIITCALFNAVNWLKTLLLSYIYAISESIRSEVFTPKSILQEVNTKALNYREVTGDLAIEKTRAERISERLTIYIVFHPSKIENVGHWLRRWTTGRNHWIEHTWAYARQNTSVSVGRAPWAKT